VIDRSRPDYLLVTLVLILMALGIVMVYSASAILALDRVGSTTFFAKKQAVWTIISLGVLFLLTRIDYHRLQRISPVLLVGSFILLILVLLVPPTRGASRWIRLGPVAFQPSELFKYSLVLFLAYSLSKRKEDIKELKFVILPYFAILGAASLLILKQPHLGAVLLSSLVLLGMLFTAGAKIRHLLLIIAPVAITAFVLVFLVGYKRARVEDYLSSIENPLKGSYQMKQSVLALGSGAG
jgi:cell division protein FtsW